MFTRFFRWKPDASRVITLAWPTTEVAPFAGRAACWSNTLNVFGAALAIDASDQASFNAAWDAGTTIEQTDERANAWRAIWNRKGVTPA